MVLTLLDVGLRIILLGVEVPVWYSHNFAIFDDRGDGPVVHIETLTTALNLRNPDDVGRYQEAFAQLRTPAVLENPAVRSLIEQLAADVRQAGSLAWPYCASFPLKRTGRSFSTVQLGSYGLASMVAPGCAKDSRQTRSLGE
jgi:hypothetical protein